MPCVVCDQTKTESRTIVSVDELNTITGATHAVDDDVILSCLRMITDEIEAFLGRKVFYNRGRVENVRGSTSAYIQLSQYPVTKIRKVQVHNSIIASPVSVDPHLHSDGESGMFSFLDQQIETALRTSRSGHQTTKTVQPRVDLIRVSYDGGFALQSEVDDAGCLTCTPTELDDSDVYTTIYESEDSDELEIQVMPETLKMACAIEAERLFRGISKMVHGDPTKRSESFADRSISWFSFGEGRGGFSTSTYLSPSTQAMIARFRKKGRA